MVGTRILKSGISCSTIKSVLANSNHKPRVLFQKQTFSDIQRSDLRHSQASLRFRSVARIITTLYDDESPKLYRA